MGNVVITRLDGIGWPLPLALDLMVPLFTRMLASSSFGTAGGSSTAWWLPRLAGEVASSALLRAIPMYNAAAAAVGGAWAAASPQLSRFPQVVVQGASEFVLKAQPHTAEIGYATARTW